MPAMTTHRTAKDHHDEITRAEVFLRGVEVELGRHVLRELLLSPCGYKPGSDWKVAVLSERYRLGLPLWVEVNEAPSVGEVVFVGSHCNASGGHRMDLRK